MSGERYESRRRGAWVHWVPLAVTVAAATVGVAAWMLSQRDNEEDEVDHVAGLDYDNADYGDNPEYGSSRGPPKPTRPGPDTDSSWGAKMSGALRRTPSPQQIFDTAGKSVAAGVAAASSAVGSALASIREEDRGGFADHETWAQEADAKKKEPKKSGRKRKTVAIVVSAEGAGVEAGDGFVEHAVSEPTPCAVPADLAVHLVAHSGTQRLCQYQALCPDLCAGSEGDGLDE